MEVLVGLKAKKKKKKDGTVLRIIVMGNYLHLKG